MEQQTAVDEFETVRTTRNQTREDFPGGYVMVTQNEYGEHVEVGGAMPWTPSAAKAQMCERNLI